VAGVARAVIVDDERLARRELRAMLAAHPEVSVVGEAETLAAAAAVVRAADATAVFLDVQLGDESGLELLPQLDEGVAVIFVTAYDRYAVRAFEVHALDYLLKPVVPARLAAAVGRLTAGVAPAAVPTPLTYDDYVCVRDGGMRFVKVRAVAAVLADANCSRVVLGTGEALQVRKPIGEWEARLPSARFVRVHRSALVNLDYVERADEWSHGSVHLHVRGLPAPLRMSRRYAAALRQRLG
jgi:two-component system LytT family response regulator